MTDESIASSATSSSCPTLMVEKVSAGKHVATIHIICGDGDPRVGGAAQGLTPRNSKRVSA